MPFFEATDASARAPRYASLRRRAVSVSEVDAAKTAWYAQRRSYRRQRKCSEFWSERIEADRADLRKLWSSVNVLLCRGSSPHSSAISAEDFCRSFDDKVAKIRAATADGDTPTVSLHPNWCITPVFYAFLRKRRRWTPSASCRINVLLLILYRLMP